MCILRLNTSNEVHHGLKQSTDALTKDDSIIRNIFGPDSSQKFQDSVNMFSKVHENALITEVRRGQCSISV